MLGIELNSPKRFISLIEEEAAAAVVIKKALELVPAICAVSSAKHDVELKVDLLLLETSVSSIPSADSIEFLTLQGEKRISKTSPAVTRNDNKNFVSLYPITLQMYD